MTIVIVGGGPVGLFMAYLCSEITYENIVILEKRIRYTRDQIIVLNKKSFSKLPGPIKDHIYEKECKIYSPRGKNPGACFMWKETNFFTITIAKLEHLLNQYINTIPNIKFINDSEVIDIHPEIIYFLHNRTIFSTDYSLLFGADGTKSIVREYIGGEPIKILKKPMYSFLGIIPEASVLNKGKEGWKFREKNWRFLRTPLYSTVTFKIKPNEYKKFKGKTITGFVDQFPNFLQKGIKNACKRSRAICKFIENGHVLEIDPTYSSIFAVDNIFLIGDAAFSTNYFTGGGLNFGISTCTYLIDLIKEGGDVISRYNSLMEIMIMKEIPDIEKVSKIKRRK